MMVLESEEHARARNARILARLPRPGLATEGYNILSPQGGVTDPLGVLPSLFLRLLERFRQGLHLGVDLADIRLDEPLRRTSGRPSNREDHDWNRHE
jgi:hypothetical protein